MYGCIYTSEQSTQTFSGSKYSKSVSIRLSAKQLAANRGVEDHL
jgi:hypothetical protein